MTVQGNSQQASTFSLATAISSPFVVNLETPLLDVVMQFAQADISCACVVKQEQLTGLVTEQAFMKFLATGQTLKGATVATVVNRDWRAFKLAEIPNLLTALNLMGRHHIRYLPLIDEANYPIGILTMDRVLSLWQQENAPEPLAEEAQQKTEEQLRLALESANMGTWDWNLETNHITWSKGHEMLFGLTLGTFDGSYEMFEMCVYPEDRQAMQEALQIALIRHQDYSHQMRVMWPDGTLHWVEGKGRFFYDESGTAVRMLGTVVDISHHVQTEINQQQALDDLELRVQERTAQLSETNRLLQYELLERKQAEDERAKLIAIIEATTDIVAMSTIDEKLHYLNSAARQLFGLSEQEDFRNFTVADCHPHWAYEIIKNQGIPTAIQEGIWVGETAFLSHDDREIPMSQLIIAHGSPEGPVKLFSTVARDITRHKEIEATVREAERRWRSLLESVRLIVVGLNCQGEIEYINPFFLEVVGYSEGEVLGKKWFEMFLPQHQQQRAKVEFLQTPAPTFRSHYQSSIITKSGEDRMIAWNDTLLRNPEGEMIGTMSIGEDITERQAIQRMKDEFVSVVSHELRTPLTSIHGALSLLSSGLVETSSERGRRVIEIAAESAERLVRLVNDILDLERLQLGKINLSKQKVSALNLLLRATEQMQVMANRAGILLSVCPAEIQFEADGDRILQVLTNLLSNAIKFSPKGSTVWLKVERVTVDRLTAEASTLIAMNKPAVPSKEMVLFVVEDEGRGIPADKLESIFERFQQVDASDSRKKGGTGLGLAICRSIIQQHGGHIWVESMLDRGSSFYFTLPLSVLGNQEHDSKANSGDR